MWAWRELRTTPGTRRTWRDGVAWAKHLRQLLAKTGTKAKVYRDLEAHMRACDREFIREQHFPGMLAIRHAFDDLKGAGGSLVRPPRGKRAGSPYELIVNALEAKFARVRALEARNRQWMSFESWKARRMATVQLELPFDVAGVELREVA